MRGAGAAARQRAGARRLHGRLRHPPGATAAHRALEAEHRDHGWRGNPAQYGAAGAILLGDLLLGWADELLGRCGLPQERVAPAHELFAQCRSEVIAGQFLDVSVQARATADVDAAMTVLRYKSAKYSIERPLQIGAALAGGGPAISVQPCLTSGSPSGRPSSCATHCSASTATPR